jgi:signal transduction histidine kinase
MSETALDQREMEVRSLPLSYVADLELEVDRLRSQLKSLKVIADKALRRIQDLNLMESSSGELLNETREIINDFAHVLYDLQEYSHDPAGHDKVVSMELRPLIEQVFGWQQRLLGSKEVTLRLDLDCEFIDWFPVRLRHILDNLISNAIRFRAMDKGEARVTVEVHKIFDRYELRISDNGTGIDGDDLDRLESFRRSSAERAAELGVGLSVVKKLLEESGGTVAILSSKRLGTTIIALLPRFGRGDFLESDVLVEE